MYQMTSASRIRDLEQKLTAAQFRLYYKVGKFFNSYDIAVVFIFL